LIDLNSSTAIKKFEGHTQRITFLKQTPCRKLISGSYDGLIKIWDIDTGECLKSIDEQSGEVIYIYIVSIDSFVASFFENNNLILFDLNSGNVIGTFVGHVSIINVIEKISNDKIVTCSNDRTLRIWSLRKSGVCLKILKGHTGIVFCLRVISNEKIISGSDDQTIKIWEIESGNCLKTLEGHTDEVYEIIQLSDEKIASSSKNGQIKIWKIKEAECIETIETGELITCLYNFSEDMILYSSQQVIAGSYSRNNILKLFNIKTKMCWRTIDIGSVFIEIKEN
jgi:WD40 repeat protein